MKNWNLKGRTDFFKGPAPNEARDFTRETAGLNKARLRVLSVILIIFFSINIVIDILHYHKQGERFFLYLDIIVVTISAVFFLFTTRWKGSRNWPLYIFTGLVLHWAVVLSVMQQSLIPILTGLFVTAVIIYMPASTALLIYLSCFGNYLITNLVMNRWDAVSMTEILELFGIILWSWIVSRIMYSSKLREFRYRTEIEALTVDQKNTIEERTLSLEKANQELREKVEERDSLIKEIHHRVRNNLQVLLSLLNLSMDDDSRSTARTVLESKNMIRSMAMIHDISYQSDNYTTVPVQEVIPEIVLSLLVSYRVQHKLTPKTDIINLNLDIDTAIILGLIVTEVISYELQTISHDAVQEGDVDISVTASPEIITLSMSIDGQSKRENLHEERAGRLLINLLAEQLNGQTRFEYRDGPFFSLQFPGN